jgi:sugar-specific transcriptional regulator TrmB
MSKIREFLKQLNFNDNEEQVYLFILANELVTVLQISNNTKISRTTVYRICEKYLEKGYLERVEDGNKIRYKVKSIDVIKNKINELENEVVKLRSKYKDVIQVARKLVPLKGNDIKVVNYNNKEEVKQLVWNVLESETETLGYGKVLLGEFVGKEFMVNWWNEYCKKDLHDRQILNRPLIEKVIAQDKSTKVKFKQDIKKHCEVRSIDKKIFKIEMETFIYNDVYAIIQYGENHLFGVEIFNRAVADQEREVFEVMWRKAKPLRGNNQ